MIKVDRVYEIRLPAEVRGLLQQLTFIISLGLEGVPLTCLGAKGYVRRLLLWMLAPWAAVFVLVIAMVVELKMVRRVSMTTSRRTSRSSNSEDRVTTTHDLMQAIQRVTPMVLRIFFLAYPIVTNVAFEAFSCYRFNVVDGVAANPFLIAVLPLRCASRRTRRWLRQHRPW